MAKSPIRSDLLIYMLRQIPFGNVNRMASIRFTISFENVNRMRGHPIHTYIVFSDAASPSATTQTPNYLF